ncbi:signal peptidase II [Desulfovibrio sp. OttesenSCG-928-F07]|nr:signal peptidase II [Desulfovibrio sp. OttesenSCG-928-F07]
MKQYAKAFGLAGAVIALDQITKAVVMAKIPLNQGITVIDGYFNLVHVLNRGAAFGFLNRSDIAWQFWLFAAFTLVAVGMVIYMLKNIQPRQWFSISAMGCILGGAIGNFIDRVRFRHVVDFLDFHIGKNHWPAFNVADIAICYGAIALALVILFAPSPKK